MVSFHLSRHVVDVGRLIELEWLRFCRGLEHWNWVDAVVIELSVNVQNLVRLHHNLWVFKAVATSWRNLVKNIKIVLMWISGFLRVCSLHKFFLP